MARGITEEDVHQAADAIVSRGERPTIERIRAELGRGSPNTVNRHIEGWWATLPKRLEPQRDGVPSEIVELARKIWFQVMPKAVEVANHDLREAAGTVEAREHQLRHAESELEQQRQRFTIERIALDRRIGELEALLSARDQAIEEARRIAESKASDLKASQGELAEVKAQLGRAQSSHAAEVSMLAERLAGTEVRLTDRLAQEKTARHFDATAARKRIKSLEEELRTDRRLLDEQMLAVLQLRASVEKELKNARKMLGKKTPVRSGKRSATSGRAAVKSPRP